MISKPVLGLDLYQTNFQMKFDKGKQSLPTWIGFVASIFMGFVIISFTYTKFDALFARSNPTVITT